jgi:hypothetical protein
MYIIHMVLPCVNQFSNSYPLLAARDDARVLPSFEVRRRVYGVFTWHKAIVL